MSKRPQGRPRQPRIVGQHYGLDVKEGDAIFVSLPPTSEIDRDAQWSRSLGWHWTYYPDGTKTIDFPKGSVRLL